MQIVEPEWFGQAYRRLVAADLASQLPGTAVGDAPQFTLDDGRQLLNLASVLALSDDARQLRLAYEIATRLVELFGDTSRPLVAAADFLLSRLGNFPGRVLLRRRYRRNGPTAPELPSRLHFERAAREAENTILEPNGAERPLTDFQHRLFSTLDRYPSVSVSAPTSAGKSFVMGLDLVRRMTTGQPSCVVYVVPTRALIREVSLALRTALRAAGLTSVPIRTVPFPLTPTEAPSGAVFVLTQERLMSFLHPRDGAPWITTLVIDEAQGVRDEARGVILQTAIEAVLIRFPSISVHFASPLSSNPEFLLGMVGRLPTGSAFVEGVPAVSQNVLLVSPVFKKPAFVTVEAIVEQRRISLGLRAVREKLNNGVYNARAAFAWMVTGEDESTVVYANDAEDAEELAKALIAGRPAPAAPPSEIAELIDFVRTEVNDDYGLIHCLPHGVAFHYGPMPAIVRTRVEDLCKAKLIKIVCCTSTLLQGVNLPARHIVIERPTRGKGNPMERRDFLNLAGRAGRLLHEFHGNVWCFRPEEWEKAAYEGEPLQTIESAIDVAMVSGGKIVQRVLSGEAKGKELDYGEATFGKLYADFVRKGKSIAESVWRTNENAAMLQETEHQLQALRITLPDEILDANRSVRPDRLQQLYEFLREAPDPRAWMPLHPGLPGSNDRMGSIIALLLSRLGGEENNRHLYLKQLAIKWIYNVPISKIISEHVNYPRKGPRKSVSTLIRNVLNDLEIDVRFRLVKYYAAFGTILQFALNERGYAAEATKVEPFHVYLECGASNPVALNLIALGLSRSTALSLMSSVRFPDDATPEDCLAHLSSVEIGRLNIPSLSQREVAELLGRDHRAAEPNGGAVR